MVNSVGSLEAGHLCLLLADMLIFHCGRRMAFQAVTTGWKPIFRTIEKALDVYLPLPVLLRCMMREVKGR